MALLYRGESRWKILKHPVFWIKVIEIVLCIIIAPLCISYSDKAGVYIRNSDKSFNITVKYPFDYNNRTVVFTDEDVPLDSFNFDPAIQVCVRLFVAVVIVTGITAAVTLLMSCAVHKNERVANKVSIAEIFVTVVMAFLLVISTSLWLYNLLDLRKEVEDEVVNAITSLGPVRCKDCVEFLPDYSALFASVGLAYLLFLIWLCNTVLVFRDTVMTSDEVNASSSLIWAQELSEKTPETRTKETSA